MVMQSPSSCAHLPKAVWSPRATKETVSDKWNTYSCTFFFLLPCVPRWALLSPWEQVTAPVAAQCRNTAGDCCTSPQLTLAESYISLHVQQPPTTSTNTSSSPEGMELLADKCQLMIPFSSRRNNQLLTERLRKILCFGQPWMVSLAEDSKLFLSTMYVILKHPQVNTALRGIKLEHEQNNCLLEISHILHIYPWEGDSATYRNVR